MLHDDGVSMHGIIYWLAAFTTIFFAMAAWAGVEKLHEWRRNRRGGVIVIDKATYDAILKTQDALRIECVRQEAHIRQIETGDDTATITSIERYIRKGQPHA